MWLLGLSINLLTLLAFVLAIGLVVDDAIVVLENVYHRIEQGEDPLVASRSEEHTSELQSLMRISYAVFCLKKKKRKHKHNTNNKTEIYECTKTQQHEQQEKRTE